MYDFIPLGKCNELVHDIIEHIHSINEKIHCIKELISFKLCNI